MILSKCYYKSTENLVAILKDVKQYCKKSSKVNIFHVKNNLALAIHFKALHCAVRFMPHIFPLIWTKQNKAFDQTDII